MIVIDVRRPGHNATNLLRSCEKCRDNVGSKRLMMKILFILNDAPYGSEKAYNALRMSQNGLIV